MALSEQSKRSGPYMSGWTKKKGRMNSMNMHQRYYVLTSDGNLWSAKSDKSSSRKQILSMTEATSFIPAHQTDLIIKGQNASGKSVSIHLRFADAFERDKWVGAFVDATEDVVEKNQIQRKEDEMEQDVHDHNEQALVNYYQTYRPENADRRKVRRFLMLFKGNMAKLSNALGHKYGASPDLETSKDEVYPATPRAVGTSYTTTVDQSSSDEEDVEDTASRVVEVRHQYHSPADSDQKEKATDEDADNNDNPPSAASSSSSPETKSEVGGEISEAVSRILEDDPSLIYDAEAVREKLQDSSPKHQPTRTQIEEVLEARRQSIREEDERLQEKHTSMTPRDITRLRNSLQGVSEDDIIMLMVELKLTPRSVPVSGDQSLSGSKKTPQSLRSYADVYGSDTSRKLMAHNDPVKRKRPTPKNQSESASSATSAGTCDTIDPELQKAVCDVLANHPGLSWNSGALQAKVKYYHPKLKPSKDQIEEIARRYRECVREQDERLQTQPTPVSGRDLERLRKNLKGDARYKQALIDLMRELRLTPRSIPVSGKESLSGSGKAPTTMRSYADSHGSDMSRRLMSYDDPKCEGYPFFVKKSQKDNPDNDDCRCCSCRVS